MPRNNQEVPQIIKIKIPAYISEPVLDPDDDTYLMMISSLVRKIDDYNDSDHEHKISRIIKGKNIKREIPNIDYDRYNDGEIPVLLLRITEKKKGFTDLSVEQVDTEDPSVLTQDDALTTLYNCAVLYPVINHNGDEISTNWIIFVYIDPGKTDKDVISVVKLVLNKILKLKIKHLKTNAANDLIRRQGLVSNLKVQYVVLTNNDNEHLNVRGERVVSKIKEIKDFEYEDVNSEDVERFVNTADTRIYNERKISVSLGGNQELKYIHRVNADQEIIKDAIEQVYNYETDMLPEELDRVYNADFILTKVRSAARQFFGNE